jgi:uncharacterized protein (UPF0332 family)
MDWEQCVKKGMIKETNPDDSMISSLLKGSENRFQSAEMLELIETTASTKVSNHYESIRTALEALALRKGFKIYNHECYVCFLREKCNDIAMSKDFDQFRVLRNQINYKGAEVGVEEANSVIKRLIDFRNKVLKILGEAE